MKWTAARLPDLRGRTAVVTGANSGIGWHTAAALAARHARVVLACRDVVRGSKAVERIRIAVPGSDVRVAGLDLASLSSVREFAREWNGPLDLLVNNAVAMAPTERTETEDGFELQFGTNHLGHFVLTGLLLPSLVTSGDGRVVTVASNAHHRGGPDVVDANIARSYDAQRAHANSKLANLLFAMELDRRARENRARLTSVAVHPGASRSRAGARSTLYAAVEPPPGSYTGPQRLGERYGSVGAARLSPLAQDEELARRLWDCSEQLTGFRYAWPGRA